MCLKSSIGGGAMFQVNDYVSYTNKGIFQVKEVQCKRNRKKEMEGFYVLQNMKNDVITSIKTPITNPSLRLVMSENEILKLIDQMPSIQTVWSDDKKIREDRFQKMLTSGDIWQWAQLSKTIYEMKKEKEEHKKMISDKDKFYFSMAEDLLFEEISMRFHIKRDEVNDFIFSKLPKH